MDVTMRFPVENYLVAVENYLVAGPPVPTSEVDFRALQTLREASLGTAAHRGDTERATASLTA